MIGHIRLSESQPGQVDPDLVAVRQATFRDTTSGTVGNLMSNVSSTVASRTPKATAHGVRDWRPERCRLPWAHAGPLGGYFDNADFAGPNESIPLATSAPR